MEPVLVDKEWLAIVPPEGFGGIPHRTLEEYMGFKYDCMWGMHDKDRHMLMAITWKDNGGKLMKVLNKVASEKVLADRVNKTFAVRYRKRGYRCEERITRTVAGADAPAQGIRFSYLAEGALQEGEAFVFKRGTRVYTLCYYVRSDLAATNGPLYEEILASLEVR